MIAMMEQSKRAGDKDRAHHHKEKARIKMMGKAKRVGAINAQNR
jgi:hypothetical protein